MVHPPFRRWSGLGGGIPGIEAQEKTEPGEEPPEIVADGGEEGVCGISGAVDELVAAHAVMFLEIQNQGLRKYSRARVQFGASALP